MKKHCLECGDEMSGRLDKKFCSDHCRANYNNRINSDCNNYMRRINRVLRRNRRILTDMNPSGKSTIQKRKLTENGFDFSYFTSTYTTKKGRIYFFCYEQGYVDNGDGFITLVQRAAAVE
jgi:hypothetical protein